MGSRCAARTFGQALLQYAYIGRRSDPPDEGVQCRRGLPQSCVPEERMSRAPREVTYAATLSASSECTAVFASVQMHFTLG